MKKHSLFSRYFLVFSFSSFLTVGILAVILFVFVSRYFQNEKNTLLKRNAYHAVTITAANYEQNNYSVINKTFVQTAYSIFASSVDADIILTNLEGQSLLAAGSNGANLVDVQIPESVMAKALLGEYEGMSTLGGIYQTSQFVVGVPVIAQGEAFGVLFVSSSAESLRLFMSAIGRIFVVSALIVLVISFSVIYLVTLGMVRPLKEMLSATKSFSQGNFSTRVPIRSEDELGQLAGAFNNMASTLAVNESARRSFVANVSHELKTPMTTIGGFVDGILDGTVPEEKREQYLQVVSTEVKRLSRLVRSMLDTARIEAGEMKMNCILFDVSETIRQAILTFEQLIEEKNLELIGFEVSKVMICADKDMLHQVVYNLLENAVKFVNPNGYIEMTYRSDGVKTYVAVRNSGAGINKEEVPQLFERFYKSDKSRSLNRQGVGLGLHIAKSIINVHHGDIVVRSVEDEYTEFEFSIPNPPAEGGGKTK